MITFLKNHFIPHEGNDHRPHFLRKESIRNVLLLIVFCELSTFTLPLLSNSDYVRNSSQLATVLPSLLATLTNQERQAQKLQPLTTDPLLTHAAELKAQDMAKNGYFAHTSPEGLTPWYWLENVGYDYQYAGENLAINFNESKDVTQAWMNSPTHRANITKDKYTQIGTGVATGLYLGKPAVYVAQVYARPFPPEHAQKKVAQVVTAHKQAKITSGKVLGAEIEVQEQKPITWWQTLFSSPRNTTQTILSLIFLFVSLALVLNTFIKIREHHPDLVIGGLLILSVIGAFLIINSYFSNRDMKVLDSVEYSREEVGF